MGIFKKRIGRMPFLVISLGIYLLAPLYVAHTWEHRALTRYFTEPQGLLAGFFRILGDGVPCFFAHQAGAGTSLEMTIPFVLTLMLVTLWRCNDCRASRRCLVLQCLPIASLFAFIYLSARTTYQPRRRMAVRRQEDCSRTNWLGNLEHDRRGQRHIA